MRPLSLITICSVAVLTCFTFFLVTTAPQTAVGAGGPEGGFSVASLSGSYASSGKDRKSTRLNSSHT